MVRIKAVEYSRRKQYKVVEYSRQKLYETVDYTRQLFFLIDNLVKLSRSFEEAERFIIVTLEEEETIEVIPLYKYLAMRDC